MKHPAFPADARFIEAREGFVRGLSTSKLNLFLEVLGKRPDGYHEIVSVFHEIDLADEITIALDPSRKADSLKAHGRPIGASSEHNLALQAVRAFRTAFPPLPRVRIDLKKRIPVGGGLGGGSSNAAFVLDALRLLTGTPATMEPMVDLARSIGSDVPFFLTGGSAVCRGRGEIVQPLPFHPSMQFVLAIPSFSLSTEKVYRSVVPDPASRDVTPFLQSLEKYADDPEASFPPCFNRLGAAASRVSPDLETLRRQLETSTLSSWSVTGSGAVMYSIARKTEDLRERIADIEKWGVLDIALAGTFFRRRDFFREG